MNTLHALRALSLAVVLVCSLASPASAAEPDASSLSAKQRGKGLLVAGSIVQVTGASLAFADIFMGGVLSTGRTFYSLATIPMAPLMVHGFDLYLSDGTRVSRLRAQAGGYFEAAGYTGVIALSGIFSSLGLGSSCHDGQVDGCFENVGGIFSLVVTVPHAITAGAMLVPAFVVTAVADHLERRARKGARLPSSKRRAPQVALAPMVRYQGGGLQLVGSF